MNYNVRSENLENYNGMDPINPKLNPVLFSISNSISPNQKEASGSPSTASLVILRRVWLLSCKEKKLPHGGAEHVATKQTPAGPSHAPYAHDGVGRPPLTRYLSGVTSLPLHQIGDRRPPIAQIALPSSPLLAAPVGRASPNPSSPPSLCSSLILMSW